MFEETTYESIMTRMLNKVRTEHPEIDTREGSLIYTAIAPCALELAIMYTELDRVLEEAFAETASLTYLERRTAERGIRQRLASCAVMQGRFDVPVNVGTRFSLGDYNYVVTDMAKSYLTCETAGSEPNTVIGELTPIDNVIGLTSAEITNCVIPGEDDEDVESLRARYFASLDTTSYGFNARQYREVVDDLDGVGCTKVIPTPNGVGGTVNLVILDSTYRAPTSELVDIVQNIIDPKDNSGEGVGLAPIGHRVEVQAAGEHAVNIQCTIEYMDSYSWDDISAEVYNVLDNYFTELSKAWETETVVVRINQINSLLMSVNGVIDVSGTTIDNDTKNLSFDTDELRNCIPIRGTINVNNE